MWNDSVWPSFLRKRPRGVLSNLITISSLGVVGLGVVIANALLGSEQGNDIYRDSISILAGIELSENCTSTGCIQPIIGITETFDLYNTSGSLTVGTPSNPICQISSTGSIHGSNCSIAPGVEILATSPINSGSVISIADSRYVKKQGDTMTGALKVRANLSGSTLNVDSLQNCNTIDTDAEGRLVCGTDEVNTYTAGQGLTLNGSTFSVNSILTGSLVSFSTVSGSVIKAATSLNSSGSLTWEGAGSGASLYVASSLRGSGLTDCDLTTSKLLWDTTTGRFSCGTDLNTPWSNTGALQARFDDRYVNTSGDTMTGALNILSHSLTGTGALFVKGVEYQTGAYLSASGAPVLMLNSYLENAQSKPQLLFGYRGNFDTNLYRRTVNTLQTDGNFYSPLTISGGNLYAVSTFAGAGLSSCSNGTTSKLLWNSTTRQFSCGTDTDTNTDAQLLFLNIAVKNQSNVVADSTSDTLTLTGSRITITTTAGSDTVTFTGPTAGQGLSYTNGAYRLNDTVTGSTIRAISTLQTDGSLVVGDASGDSVTWNAGTMALNNNLSIDSDTLYINPTSNSVGIGTAPTQKFHVYNPITSAGVYKNMLSVSSGALSSNGNLFQLALSFECYTSPLSGVTDGGYCMGFDGVSQLRGAGTISEIYGARYTLGTNALASGTVSTVYGDRIRILNQGSANGSVITTGYGIYIDDIQASNGFGIYQGGTNDTNYFAGDVGIGTNAPATKLEVRNTGIDGNVLRLRDSDGTCDHNPEAGSETVTCSSDRILKEDIRSASGMTILSNLMKYKVHDFRVKKSGNRMIGVIAQEVQATHPDRVKDIITPATYSGTTLLTDTGSHLGVVQPSVWELLLAIQELKREVDELKEELRKSNKFPITGVVN